MITVTAMIAPDAVADVGAATCATLGVNAGAPVWGGSVILDDARADAIAATGASTVRVNFRLDDREQWDEVALARYDDITARLAARDLSIVALVGYEADPSSQLEWNDDSDGDGINDVVVRLASTTAMIHARYRSVISAIEVWNEPNCWSEAWYRDDPQHAGCTYLLPRVFAKLLAEVRLRAPDATIVLGGLLAHDIDGSFSDATDYLDELYRDGVWDWLEGALGRRYAWDMIAYHPYVEQGGLASASTLSAYLDSTRALASAQGDAAPFLLTEVGWSIDGVSADQQAANLDTAFSLALSRADVAGAQWFNYDDAPGLSFGLVDAAGVPRPALDAFRAHMCPPSDGGPTADAGVTDSPADAGAPDAGQGDAGQGDAGQGDAGQGDGDPSDGGQRNDGGVPDAGAPDDSAGDAGVPGARASDQPIAPAGASCASAAAARPWAMIAACLAATWLASRRRRARGR